MVGARGWGIEVMGHYGLVGIVFQSCKDQNSSEMDGSNGYTKI